ncbi:MAG: 4Fe-4S dicluster domain-containing protein [bacterium]|nr:4Fe-4S dicluster domain-containing protein [bacterium]
MNMPDVISRQLGWRRIVQWCLLPIVLVTIALGWRYPLLGFSVPVVMLMGMIGGAVRGRYVCGHLCPRGSFFDRLISLASRKSPIPNALRNRAFRWVVFACMMGFMAYRVSVNPASIYHWGRVFWVMCVITTAIGVVLGVAVHQRTWCAFCPMGTVQSALGGKKKPLQIDSDLCVECGKCEKACPINLAIIIHKDSGVLNEPDCLKCPECIAACPTNALSWPTETQKPDGDSMDS